MFSEQIEEQQQPISPLALDQYKNEQIQQDQQQNQQQYEDEDEQAMEDYEQNYNELQQQEENKQQNYEKGEFKLLKFDDQPAEDLNKKLIGVIVTICDNSSYDDLFTSIPQKPDEGTRVRVYTTNSSYLPDIIKSLKAPIQEEISKDTINLEVLKELIADIKSVEADNVVFNWECCEGCDYEKFHYHNQVEYFEMIKFLVDKGFFLMFSDFSLKALIKQWNEKLMGPNPFVKISETDSQFILRFDPKILQECDSSQLQKVGELCQQGFCNVDAMGNTIMYTVDWQKAKTDSYSLQVLTIVTQSDRHTNPSKLCKEHQIQKIGEHTGSAGHIILSYPGGGKILTSMGHWIELMKLDTTTKELLELAERDFGKEYAQQMQEEMECLESEADKKEYRSKKAAYIVQSAMPQKNSYNMKKKNKKY